MPRALPIIEFSDESIEDAALKIISIIIFLYTTLYSWMKNSLKFRQNFQTSWNRSNSKHLSIYGTNSAD